MLEQWGHVCVVCGRSILDVRAFTVEHLIPRSLGGSHHDNTAPSHYVCNMKRRTFSLVAAAKLIDQHFDLIVRQAGLASATRWLNKPHPNKKHRRP